MESKQPPKTLYRFFTGLTEQTFQVQLGVVDPEVTEYISRLLIRFVRTDSLHKVRNLVGEPVREVGQMLVEAEARIGDARREVHRHIGDFTLFWAGLYPESLRRRGSVPLDRFNDYCHQGKRAYLIASAIETDGQQDPPSDVLERLGHHFEMCAYGLREIRREWERRDDDDIPRPFLIN